MPLGMFCFTLKSVIEEVISLFSITKEMFAFAIVDNEIDEFNTWIKSVIEEELNGNRSPMALQISCVNY